jgi:hypothetical protein
MFLRPILFLALLSSSALAQIHITRAPFTINNTGSYVLDKSVVGTIRISAFDVTLDLGGNTVSGSVMASHVMRVVIQNGKVDSGSGAPSLIFNNVVGGKVTNLVLIGSTIMYDCSSITVANNSIVGMPPAIYSGLSDQGTSSRLANSFPTNSVSIWPTIVPQPKAMALSPFDTYSSNMFPGFGAGVTPVTGGVKQ